MPELPEVEAYRRLVDSLGVGRTVSEVCLLDPSVADVPEEVLRAALVGARLTGVRREGKRLRMELRHPAGSKRQLEVVLGLSFGMTGCLAVDGVPGVHKLVFAPTGLDHRHRRIRIGLEGSRRRGIELYDSRRFGRVWLNPKGLRLGPDALEVTGDRLGSTLGRSSSKLKSALLDQRRLAGVGNLVADETLWRAGLDPNRSARSLGPEEFERLAGCLRQTLVELMAAGGSHTGQLFGSRRPGGRCPWDGCLLRRGVISARTTWWCPSHQR